MEMDSRKIYQYELGVAALIVVAFVLFDVFPAASRILSLWQAVRAARVTATSLPDTEKDKVRQKLIEDNQTLENGLESMHKIVATVEEKISGEKDIPKMTLKLEELATTSDINVLSVKPMASEAKGGYESVSIALEIECEYAQLVQFLSQWDKTQFYLTVRELSISPVGNMSAKLAVHLTVDVLFKAL